LQVIDGKARLVGDLLCDGLGACLQTCPEDAISIEEREAEPYNEARVLENLIGISIRKGEVKEGEAGDGSKTSERKIRGRQRIAGQAIRFFRGRVPGNALSAPCAGIASVAAPEPGHTWNVRPSWAALWIVGGKPMDRVGP